MKKFSISILIAIGFFSIAEAKPIHLKVDGEGYLVMSDSEGNRFYTPEMNFYRSKYGDFITYDKKYSLQAKAISSDGTTSSELSNLNLSMNSSGPQETYQVFVSANLDSSTAVRTGSSVAFSASSVSEAESTSDFNISSIVYDSLGNPHTIIIYFCHTGANLWDYHVLSDLRNLDSRFTSGTGTFVLQEGSLAFNANGSFERHGAAVTKTMADTDRKLSPGERIDPSVSGNIGEIRWGNGAQAVKIGTSWGWFAVFFGTDFSSSPVMTQFSAPFSVWNVSQDGYGNGALTSIQIKENGILIGSFSNGISRDLYQIPVAQFMGEDFLTQVAPGVFGESADSGPAAIGQANSAGRSKVIWLKP